MASINHNLSINDRRHFGACQHIAAGLDQQPGQPSVRPWWTIAASSGSYC